MDITESKLREVPEEANDKTKEETAFVDSLQNAEKELAIAHRSQHMQEQKAYARKAFWLVASWIGGVYVLLLLNGGGANLTLWGNTNVQFKLQISENVMLAVVGTTTLNIIAVFYFVMKYLFDPKRGP